MSCPLTNQQAANVQTLVQNARTHVEQLEIDTSNLDFYVVGGAVRDALLGEDSNDMDFVVENETRDSMITRGFIDTHASSFGVFHDESREEWSLTRTETNLNKGYKTIETNHDNVSLSEDLKRRDLTVNAIALQPIGTGGAEFSDDDMITITVNDIPATLIDPHNGMTHLRNGILQHVTQAYADDPIRVLRTARYLARYIYTIPGDDNTEPMQFQIADETKELMRLVAPQLNRMSRERIGEEIVKALTQASDPVKFFTALRDVGALAVIAPELDRASIVPAGPKKYHREGDTFTHTMMVLEEMHNICESRNVTGVDRVRRYLIAVAHDLGKVQVADQHGGLWSDDPPREFGGHASVGGNIAPQFANRLGLGNHYTQAMVDACELHMKIHDLPIWPTEELLEFVQNHTPPTDAETPYYATVSELLDLAAADHQGRWQTNPVVTDDSRNIEAYDAINDGPEDIVQPVFERDTFEAVITRAQTAINKVSGYDVLRDGLCDTHSDSSIENDSLSSTLSQCDDCRTPGPWVGDEIAARRANYVDDTDV